MTIDFHHYVEFRWTGHKTVIIAAFLEVEDAEAWAENQNAYCGLEDCEYVAVSEEL